MPNITAIAAADLNGGIGLHNQVLCRIAKDMKRFKEETTGHIVIMGRKTFESIGQALPGRINIVVSSTLPNHAESTEELIFVESPKAAMRLAEKIAHLEQEVFVIGGAQIYEQLLPYCDFIDITRIQEEFEADTHIKVPEDFIDVKTSPEEIDGDYKTVQEFFVQQGSLTGGFDESFQKLCNQILNEGSEREERTGVGAKSVFAPFFPKIDLREGFPLLTSKHVPFRIVAEELLWFISGSTDLRDLHDKDVHIWDADAVRFYNESKRGLSEACTQEKLPEWLDILSEGHYTHRANEVSDLGPIYGAQWRDFYGMDPEGNHVDVDQLQRVVDSIKKDPYSRRHLVVAWNPVDIEYSSLPPCHYAFQFYVDNGTLSCKFEMRSTDVFLGLPFNIASYALLTHFVAHLTGLTPAYLIPSLGDAHIYNNHIEAVEKMLVNLPRNLPKLDITGDVDTIDDFTIENCKLTGYYPHAAIPAPINAG